MYFQEASCSHGAELPQTRLLLELGPPCPHHAYLSWPPPPGSLSSRAPCHSSCLGAEVMSGCLVSYCCLFRQGPLWPALPHCHCQPLSSGMGDSQATKGSSLCLRPLRSHWAPSPQSAGTFPVGRAAFCPRPARMSWCDCVPSTCSPSSPPSPKLCCSQSESMSDYQCRKDFGAGLLSAWKDWGGGQSLPLDPEALVVPGGCQAS